MNCELCSAEHTGDYGSGRFCSSKCARKFSTHANRDEISKKVSLKLKGTKPTPLALEKYKEYRKLYSSVFFDILMNKPFEELSKFATRNRVLIEQAFTCDHCKLKEWYGLPITLELDHIDGNNKNNSRINLHALCPNCHSLTPTWRGKRNAGRSNKEIRLDRYREWLKNLKKSQEFHIPEDLG
jgi:hypothetical protein